MVKRTPRASDDRTPLSRERVLRGAMALADESGLAALTIRSLAQSLGLKPMSLYHYVANKDEILDGIVDLVFAEIELPEPGEPWREALSRRARSARLVLLRHAWAIALMESRKTPGPATLKHHDAILGALRTGGFPLKAAAHAYALLDAYVYGAALQEAALPFQGPDSATEVTASIVAMFDGDAYPHLREIAMDHVMQPGYDFGDEFEFGLELILGALESSLLGDAGSAGGKRGAGSSGLEPAGTPTGS